MKNFALLLVLCMSSFVLFSCSGKGKSVGYTMEEIFTEGIVSSGAKTIVKDGDALRHGMTGPDLSGKKFINTGGTPENQDFVYIYKKSDNEYFLYKCSKPQTSFAGEMEAKEWLKEHFKEEN